MPNWDALSKLIGWAPGAALGGLIGAVLGVLSFDSMASSCATGTFPGPLGPVALSSSCVQTVFGDFYAATTFATMTGVFGAVLGIAGQLAYQAYTKPAAP